MQFGLTKMLLHLFVRLALSGRLTHDVTEIIQSEHPNKQKDRTINT